MNKVKKLELKRLLKKLDYLKYDFEYTNEIISESNDIFIDEVNNILKRYPELKKEYKNKLDTKIYNSVKIKSDNNNENIKPSKAVKKLYRDIAKLTHPDIVKNEKINEVYLASTLFYKNNDIVNLYKICDYMGVNYNISLKDEKIIKKEINSFKKKISFLKSNFTWKWINSDDDKIKKEIVLNFIKKEIK